VTDYTEAAAEAVTGAKAPDFRLQAADRQEYSLKDYAGQMVVLYFYPKDSTPGCTQEACDFRDYNGRIEAEGAVILGISPDSLKSHGKFADKHSLPFPLLSDPEHEVCERYGVWQLKKMAGREYMGVVRSTFLIDGEGRIVREWRKVKVNGHVDEVLQAIQELKSIS
jgi:thioredoxin-dependent peroxiredoxin